MMAKSQNYICCLHGWNEPQRPWNPHEWYFAAGTADAASCLRGGGSEQISGELLMGQESGGIRYGLEHDGFIMIISMIMMVIKIMVIYDGLSRLWSFLMVYQDSGH